MNDHMVRNIAKAHVKHRHASVTTMQSAYANEMPIAIEIAWITATCINLFIGYFSLERKTIMMLIMQIMMMSRLVVADAAQKT